MSKNSTRWYRVEHRVSGFDAGVWQAETPEEAIAAMMADAGCDEPPSPDWVATEVEMVDADMVDTASKEA